MYEHTSKGNPAKSGNANRFDCLGDDPFGDKLDAEPTPREPITKPTPSDHSVKFLAALSEPVRQQVTRLLDIHTGHTTLVAEFQNQALELEQKFYDQFESEYNERSAVIGGIPEFWLSAMKNQPSIAEIITPRDEPALRHLTDIRMKYLNPASSGFCLSFHFSENEFFTNEVLSKTYRYEKGSDYTGELTYGKTSGNEILWRHGKNLTFEEVELGEMNNITGEIREGEESEFHMADSFFNFFSPPDTPSPEDENAVEDIEWLLDDCARGEEFKEKVIPYAVHWYTGEATLFEKAGSETSESDDDDDSSDEGSEGSEE